MLFILMMVVDIHGHTFMCPQIRQLAQEIRELTVSNPVTFFNGNSGSSGMYISVAFFFYFFSKFIITYRIQCLRPFGN